jgi:hypothetical protein
MMDLIQLIPLAWGAAAAFVLAVCKMASRADAEREPVREDAGRLTR